MPSLDGQASAGASLENVSVEDVSHAACELDELTEAWNDRFTCGNPRFAERYVKGELELGVFFDLFDRAGNRKEFGAVFNRFPAALRRQGKYGHFKRPIFEPFGWNDGENICLHEARPYRNDFVVFIHDVEFAENPERFAPTLIRLEPAYKLLGLLAGSLYGTLEVAGELSSTCADREASAVSHLHAVRYNTLAYEMVERRSQVMDNIPDDQRNLAWDGFVDFEPEDVIASFRIILSNDSIWISRTICPEFGIEIGKMMFGPLDLRANTG